MPLKGGLRSLHVFIIGRMPGNRTLRSLDASHAIPTRVLRYEDSGLRRLLTVDFGTPSYKFTVNICTYLIL
jgi:hypothetical protein